MNRLQEFLDNPHMMTGTATIAANAKLTLVAANDAFYALIGETAAPHLLSLLAPGESPALVKLLAAHPARCEWEGMLCGKPKAFRVRLSAVRMEGVLHENRHAVYLVAFTDVGMGDVLRSAEYEHLKYALIADISEDLPFEYDFPTDTIAYTPKYRDIFGQEPVIHRFRERLRKGEACDPVSKGFRDAFLSLDTATMPNAPENAPEQFLSTSTGSRWFALYRTTLYDDAGKAAKSVGALRDIDRQKREQLRLLDKSRTDAMTGLFNKATTEEEIRMALREARPDSLGVLFMIDIDNFKNINDNMGHLAGDSIIMEIARQLGRIFRQRDIIGRVGGDEFHVYMREVTDPASIRERAQKLCSSIRNLFINSNLDKTISVSVGIVATDHPLPYEDMFRKADVALYQAKGNGKNRYEFFGQTTDAEEGTHPSSPLAVNTVRNSIMVDIIDILFSMCDMREGIDRALEFIGNALRVDKLLIFEYTFDGTAIRITHEWCAEPKWATPEDSLGDIPVEKLHFAKPLDASGIYYCSDLAALPPEEKTFLLDPSISSLLQCDIVRDRNVVGHICFEERGRRRIWTQQEVDALILMSKLIGEYIRQRQSSGLLQRSYEDTRSILDNLPSTAVYVIDSDHRIVYFNDTVAKAYPNARKGLTCHSVFWDRTTPCTFCPVSSHGELSTYTTLLEHSPFQSLAEVSLSKILWENKPAHVVLISEHLQTPEEREAKVKRESLARALYTSYHYVLDVNLDTGSCDPIAGRWNALSLPAADDYAQHCTAFLKRVVPSFHAGFLEHFSLENLRKTFGDAREDTEIHFEYQYIEPEGPRWRSRIGFAYAQDDGSHHVLLCIRDIEKQKSAELERRQKEERVGIALQNSYAKIYQMDLSANTLTCLFCNTDLIAPIDVTGHFDEDIRRVETRVHPEDRATFLSFFNAEHILRGLEAGTELSGEYRKLGLDGTYHWMLALIVPLPSGTLGEGMVLVRDVTESKREETDYLLALQSNYTEIFRLDLTESTLSPLYYDSAQVAIQTSAMDIESFVRDRGDSRVHPENTKAFHAFYDVARIAGQIENGTVSQIEYRKRPSGNTPYRWVSAAIRPIPGAERQALLLLRDVTELRAEEANFYKVLQSSYTEIYEITLDTDSVRVLYRDSQDVVSMPELSLHYWADTQIIAEQSIHPDDRASFLEHYAPENIRSRLADDPRLMTEYRIRANDGESYRWLSSLLLPMPGIPGRLLILCQDIDTRKQAEETAVRLERRQSAVFRQSGDCIIEVNMRTWQYIRDVSTPLLPDFAHSGDYRDFFSRILSHVHPEDRERVETITNPEFLLNACRTHSRTITAQYRLINNGVELWLENRVFFLEDAGDMTAFFLIRDISEQKRLESERALEEERFNLALRNTYTEIYEVDLHSKAPHLVYANRTPMIPVDEDTEASLEAVAARLIHPEDRACFLSSLTEANVRNIFREGYHAVPAEYRRRGSDGKWYWVAAALVPLCAHDACRSDLAMLLVRDITEQREEEQRRRISEQYDHALRNIYDELYELNVTQNSYRIVYHVEGKYVTPADHGSLDGCIDEVSGHMIHPEDKARFLEFFDLEAVRRRFATGREYLIGEFRKLWQDGKYHWASLTMFPVAQTSGGDEMYLVFIMDIGERKQAEEIAQQNVILERQRLDDERYRTIVEQTDTLVFEWDLEAGRYISPEIVTRFGGNYDSRDLMHIWRDDGVIHHDDEPLLKAFLEETHVKSYTEMTVRLRKRGGDYIWCKVALTCLRDEHGRPKRYIGTLNDVDSATQSVLALKYRAEFDLLTDIYNMHTFYSQTEQILRAHPERRYSIIRMDIDRFKVINDLYGLKEGDKLLIFIAGLLREKMGKHGVYGRLGGDVFCMCTDSPRPSVLSLIRELTDSLAGYPLAYKIVPSFGICEVDNIDTPINVLCDWANLALKTIKGNYLNSYAFYDGKLREKILEEKTIENQMHDAMLQGQFVLYLQPKVHIPTSRIIGSEGLVRWIHPTEGLLPPDRFIPLFEKNGFILRLDEYIWEQACITLRRWIDHGLVPTPISVNMSRMHIHDPRLREKLLGLIQRYNIPPRLLELEITESAFLDNEGGLFQAMRRLQDDGFQFSMDDFGSGYSSLNMLKSMPVDFIKIDRGFLNEVVATERGKTVIRFSISLAKEMNIKVIAEGVESEEQAAFLLQAGCAYAQGYFYSRPLTVPGFEDLAFGTDTPFPVAPSIRAIAEKLSA